MTTDWETGEIVTLQRIDKMLKKNRTTAYPKIRNYHPIHD